MYKWPVNTDGDIYWCDVYSRFNLGVYEQEKDNWVIESGLKYRLYGFINKKNKEDWHEEESIDDT